MSILLGSNLRRKLLAYTFTHPDETYYVRELAGIIDVDVGNLSRELKRLEKEGLYKHYSKGNIKFYSLSKDYPLYEELKTVIYKTEGVIGTIKKIVNKYKGITLAVIYGSYAQDRVTKTSDIDLIVVGEFRKNKFMHDIRSLETKLNREINYTLYGDEEFGRERNKNGAFLEMVLKNKIIILKGELSDK